jgi:hypothetical protein
LCCHTNAIFDDQFSIYGKCNRLTHA